MEYTIGEIAQQVGVNIQTVRYYERIDLLPEVKRNSSGYRVYTGNHIEFLKLVIFAKNNGFSLKEISDYCRTTIAKGLDSQRLLQLIENKINSTESEIQTLKKQIDLLQENKKIIRDNFSTDKSCPITKIFK